MQQSRFTVRRSLKAVALLGLGAMLLLAIGFRCRVDEQGHSVVPPPREDDSQEKSAVLIFWAKTHDYDVAPRSARPNSEAPPYTPPTIYPPVSKDTLLDAEFDPAVKWLPGGAAHAIRVELPTDATVDQK